MSETGLIHIHREMGALGIEQLRYQWTGNNRAWISGDFLDHQNLPKMLGAMIEIGPYSVRIIDYGPSRRSFLVERGNSITTWLHWQDIRLAQLLDLAYRRTIITAAVWGLATYREYEVPTWRDIHALRRFAKFRRVGE